MPRGRLLLIAALVLTGLTAAPASAAEGPYCEVIYSVEGELTLRDSKPLDVWLDCTNGNEPGDDFGLEVSGPPAHGMVGSPTWDPSLESSVLRYDPDDGYLGSDQLTLTASDGTGVSELEINFWIEPNRAPVCSAPNQPRRDPTYWHGPVGEPQATVLECVDLDRQDWYALDPEVAAEPRDGTVAVETYLDEHWMVNLSVTYTPDPAFTGSDTFVIGASDGALSDLLTFHVTVADGLWCTDADPLHVDAGRSVTTYTYCSDPNNGTHTIEVVDGPAQGTTTVEGRLIHYTADAGASGHDSFTFRATSPTGDSNLVTQEVQVVPNAAPVCERITPQVASASVPTFVLTCADADDDPVSLAVHSQPAHGSLGEIADGQVTYTPDPDFVGVDRFTYVGSDYARTSAPATVRITVDDGKAPVLTLGVGRQTTRHVARRGLSLSAMADEQVAGRIQVSVSGRTAKRLGLVRRADGPLVVGSVRDPYQGGVPAEVRLTLRPRTATAIRSARRVAITVRFRGVDPLGNVSQVTRRVTLRR